MADISDNTHNFACRLRISHQLKMLAQDVFAIKETFHKRLIDQHHSRGARVVALIHPSAHKERNPHGRQIAARHLADLGIVELAGAIAASRNVERVVAMLAAEWQIRSGAYSLDSRERLDPFFQLLPESRSTGGIAIRTVGRLIQTQARSYYVLCLKTGVHMNESPETFEKQSRAYQQRDRYRDFSDDQRAAEPFVSLWRRRSAGFFQTFGKLPSGDL